MALANTVCQIDDGTRRDGWEPFPTAQLAVEHYGAEYKQQRASAKAADLDDYAPPTAPTLASLVQRGAASLLPADRDLLQLEPPSWMPDSQASDCLGCHLPFRPLLRLRHHCRQAP